MAYIFTRGNNNTYKQIKRTVEVGEKTNNQLLEALFHQIQFKRYSQI